jgi:hypothetical protein
MMVGVGIIRGNPGVFQLHSYPPSGVRVFVGWGKGF